MVYTQSFLVFFVFFYFLFLVFLVGGVIFVYTQELLLNSALGYYTRDAQGESWDAGIES